MKPCIFGFVLLPLLFATVAATGAGTSAAIAGTWEGESKCVVGLPCHDEHVIYEIKNSSPNDASFKVDGFKVIKGQRVFMGTLDCIYQADRHILTCSGRPDHDDNWEFKVDGNTMAGTLTTVSSRTLYRRIAVMKK